MISWMIVGSCLVSVALGCEMRGAAIVSWIASRAEVVTILILVTTSPFVDRPVYRAIIIVGDSFAFFLVIIRRIVGLRIAIGPRGILVCVVGAAKI